MKVAIITYSGYNESELAGIISCLKLTKISYKVFLLSGDLDKHHLKIKADYHALNELDDSFSALIFPGGSENTLRLKEDTLLLEKIKDFYYDDKLVAAICAAPSVLGEAGILKTHNYTVYPGFEKKAYGTLLDQPVVLSGNVITARSMYFVHDFSLEIIKYLLSTQEKETVEKQIKGIE